MPAIPDSVTVTGFVAPTDSADTFPSHTEEWGRGGYRTVADITERNGIPAGRRKEGMKVFVVSNGTEYTLGSGLLDADWVVSKSGTRVVPLWSDLSAIAAAGIPNGTAFRVLGRAAVGDGGEGNYWYDSSSSITVIPGLVITPASGGGRFLREYGLHIDPARDMGADNNGSDDAQPIIQAAINFAADPTYGWAKDAGQVGQASITVMLSPGAYRLEDTINVKAGVEFIGAKKGSASGDFGNNTVLFGHHGGTIVKWDWYNDGTSYRQGSIRHLFIVGRSETYQQNKKAIKSVSSRTVFVVDAADAPPAIEDRQIYDSNNTCFFFSPLGQYLGSARVLSTSTVGSDCTVTLQTGSDYYSSINSTAGNLLTTDCKVVWAARVTGDEATTVGNFNAPSRSGVVGLQLVNTSTVGFGGLCRIEDIYITHCHTGIEFGPRLVGGHFKDITVKYCRFAGLAYPRSIFTTDHVTDGLLLFNGTYFADYDSDYSAETVDQPEFHYCTYGVWNLSPLGKYARLQCEHNAYADLFVSRAIMPRVEQLLCDNANGNGLVIGPGFYAYSGPTTSASSNWLSIGSGYFRGQTDALPADTLHDRVAIKFETPDASDTAKCAFVSIGELQIVENGSTRLFTYAFDLKASAYNNRVMVGSMPEKNGYTSMYAPSSKLVEWGTHLGLDTAAEVQTGWYGDATKRVFAFTGNDVLKMEATGTTLGSSSFTDIPLKSVVGNATTVAKFTRSSGSAQNYEVQLAAGVFKLNDTDLSRVSMTIFSNASVNQLWVGSNLGNATARTGNIYFEQTTGTDAAAADANIVAPGGTGNSTSGGTISIWTYDAGASSSTAQGLTRKAKFKKQGQFWMTSISTPSVDTAEGDIWFNSAKGWRQRFGGVELPKSPTKMGTATLVGGTVTVSTSLATATCIVTYSVKTLGGTVGNLSYTVSAGVSFTINSDSGTDTSTIHWQIWEP